MPTLHRENAEINYEVRGDLASGKTALLFLHGNGESMEIFDETISHLHGKSPLILMDSRGQGKSTIEKKDGKYEISYQIMTDDTESLLDELCVGQVDVVGHSDGGIIALMLGMGQKRDRIRRIITTGANTNPDGLVHHMKQELKRELKNAIARRDGLTAALMNMMLTEPNITTDALSRIYAQTAIIVGAHDCIKHEHSEHIANAIMHGRLYTIPGVDHDIPSKAPKALADIILDETH